MSHDGAGRTRVVLLGAGLGKRMKSSKPKVLHEVLGKSILARIISACDELNAERIHVVIGHGADQVKEHLQNISALTPISTHLQEPQLGTGHALMQVVPELESFHGTLLVSVADTPLLTAKTLRTLIEEHQRSGAVVSLLTTEVEDAKNYGRILRDESGKVTGIIEDRDASDEQRKIREINPAIYCFQWPEVREALSTLKNDNRQKEYYLTDVIGWAHENGRKMSSVLAPDWREVSGINSRLELAEAARLLRDITLMRLSLEAGVTILDPDSTWISPEVKIGQETVVLPSCMLIGDIEIGESCVVGPNVTMHGHVVVGNNSVVQQSLIVNSEVGANCRIGPFAHLREHTVVHNNVRVGNFVEVKKSVIDDKTNASHLSYVGDATLGKGVNIGAGTITANYNHITKVKSRTTICDGASTGSNAVLVAPVTVGENAVVAAGSVVTKDVPPGNLAVTRPPQVNKEGWYEREKRKVQVKSEAK
ncbi:MAG TPA: bifunctional UDP-N-acetylglucosamine diphosphorylase/glucosamine-1-phosphate N-acetyltransferase GlmU [Candidatus Obscuribacterales bacterium]